MPLKRVFSLFEENFLSKEEQNPTLDYSRLRSKHKIKICMQNFFWKILV